MSELRVCRQPEPDEQALEETDVKYTYVYNITAAAEQSDITDWITGITLDNLDINLCSPAESNTSCFFNLSLVPTEEEPFCTVQNARGFGCQARTQTLRVVHSQTCSSQHVRSDVAEVLADSSRSIPETFREDRSEIFQNNNDDDSSLTSVQLNTIHFQLLEESSSSSLESSDHKELTLGGMTAVILSGVILLCATILMIVGCQQLCRVGQKQKKRTVPKSGSTTKKRDKWQSYVAKASSRALCSKAVPSSQGVGSSFDPAVVTVERSGTHQSFVDAIECGVSDFDSDADSFPDYDSPMRTKIRRIAIVPVETMVSGASDTKSLWKESSFPDEDVTTQRDLPFGTYGETAIFESVETSLDSVDIEAVKPGVKPAQSRSYTSFGPAADRSGQAGSVVAPRNNETFREDVQTNTEALIEEETTPIETVRNSFGEVEIEAVRLRQSMWSVTEQGDQFEAVEAKLNIEEYKEDTKIHDNLKDQQEQKTSDPSLSDTFITPNDSKRPFFALRQASASCPNPSADCGLIACNVNIMQEALMFKTMKTHADTTHDTKELPSEPGMTIVKVVDDEKSDLNVDSQGFQEYRSKSEPTVSDCDFQDHRSISVPTASDMIKHSLHLNPAQSNDKGGPLPLTVEADTWSSDSTEGIAYDQNNRLLASDLMDDTSDDGMGISSHLEDFSESMCREDTVFSGSCAESSICHDRRSEEFKRIWSESDGSTLFALSEDTEGEALSAEETEICSDLSPKKEEHCGRDHGKDDGEEEEDARRYDSLAQEDSDVINYVRTIQPERSLPYTSRTARSIQL